MVVTFSFEKIKADQARHSGAQQISAGELPDRAGTGNTATGTLTYCQAELRIDSLLTAIGLANSQLAGIREIEQTRQEKNNAFTDHEVLRL
ncbi:TPA: hypothetical protein RQO47_001142 [Klebsiella michiganensis]|nr:hypothetical protein [Klebsiella michiganensis]